MSDSDNKVKIVIDQDGHTRDKFGNPIQPLLVPDEDKHSVKDDGSLNEDDDALDKFEGTIGTK
jgi:hypothetical protein